MKSRYDKFKGFFTERAFFKKMANYARQAGLKTAYAGLLLYYAYRKKDTPAWAKRTVLGVLGYFISPFDALPDFTPFVGYTDDLGVLTFGLVTIACYVDKTVKKEARAKLTDWFGEYDAEELEEVDERL